MRGSRRFGGNGRRGEHGDPFSGRRHIIGEQKGRPIYLFGTDSPLRNMSGDFEAMALYAGKGAGLIESVPPAAERLKAIVNEALDVLGIAEPTPAAKASASQYSSPACSMHEVSDVYMGYAGKEDLVPFLNELLEAERAGARVALDSARQAGTGPLADLLRAVQRDEARWCSMLVSQLRTLGEQPSTKTGAFYGKAMAITELHARTAFLNRGQGWVVRKLREMLPRVRNDALHAELCEMLRSHELNIDRTNEVAGRA
jgi:nitronate monooxygenase